jgi:hypothetical protein
MRKPEQPPRTPPTPSTVHAQDNNGNAQYGGVV